MSFLHAKIVITLYPIVEVKKSDVLLKDIAKVKSSQERLKDFIENIKIKEVDRVTKISKEEIKNRLRENYIDLKSVIIKGSNRVIVRRAIKKISQIQIEEDLRKFLYKRYGKNIEIKSIGIGKKEITLPDGKIAKKIQKRNKSSNNIYLNYELYVDGERYLSLPINVRVEFFTLAPFAKRDIPKGKIIDFNDIYFKKYPKRSSRDCLTKEDIIGKIAKRVIRRDSVIKRYYLLPNFKVFKNRNVKILYSKGALNIELLGLALENGALGDIIRVKNISTNKVIKCKVVGPFTVKYID